ncbi:MAG: metal ABC transporter solute-binding protein, Zn/Mn family [Pseudonocardiaceae bacterium]
MFGTRRRRHLTQGAALVVVTSAVVAGCATAAPAAPGGPGSGKVEVVAAENFWGSIAAQLGGERVSVTSIIRNPDADPHNYEPTPADARAVASARYVVVNGVGYDPWAAKLVAADPVSSRTVLTVGDLVGVPPGGNPHRWYSPDDVHRVAERITADYKKIDPADAAYFDQRKQAFETRALARYNQLISQIRTRYAGTPIGASESIVTPLADDLGLRLLTPESFLDAISEGTDPTTADKSTVDEQIKSQQIKVYLYNSQNATPDVAAQVTAAKAAGIPTATVTETLVPATATFQDWQSAQLQGIAQALARATGH